MNGHTIGAIVENYEVAMLVGHNVMHYNDSLKGDNVHESFEPHSKVFQNSHFVFSSIIRARFSSKFTKSQWQKNPETNIYNIFSCFFRVCFRSPEVSSDH